MRWSSEVMLQNRCIIYPLGEDAWTPHYARCWYIVRGSHPWRHDSLITWSMIHHMTLKNLSSLSQDLWQLNLTGCWIWGGGSACKCSSHHQVLFMILSMSSVNKFSNSIHLPTKSQSSVPWHQATWAKYTTTKTIFFSHL